MSLNIEYKNRYQIKKHEWKKNGVTITGYNYGYDTVGNKVWSENLVTSNKSELFAFDTADRLTSFKTGTLNGTKTAITSPTFTHDWVLDQIGNWSQFNDNGANSINQFSNTHEMTLFKGVTNTFDNNGNLTSDGVRTFKYDAFNRIIEVKIGAVILAQYQYDVFNRRVMKKVDADLNGSFETTVKFLYDGFRCIEELNASDSLTKEYVYGSLYIDEIILQRTIATATDYYFTHDYRYSVTSLIDSNNITTNFEYKVYGQRTVTGSGSTDIGYTGQRHDAETGLMYFKNRYFSTSMGSFVTRDPLGYVDGMSMYLGYFGGDGVDPTGERDGTTVTRTITPHSKAFTTNKGEKVDVKEIIYNLKVNVALIAKIDCPCKIIENEFEKLAKALEVKLNTVFTGSFGSIGNPTNRVGGSGLSGWKFFKWNMKSTVRVVKKSSDVKNDEKSIDLVSSIYNNGGSTKLGVTDSINGNKIKITCETLTREDQYNFLRTSAHEVGHSMGLDHFVSVKKDYIIYGEMEVDVDENGTPVIGQDGKPVLKLKDNYTNNIMRDGDTFKKNPKYGDEINIDQIVEIYRLNH